MSRIQSTFSSLDRPALITFITAGDPDYESSLTVLRGLAEAGADIIELGMPFTDPMADGPVIQEAGTRALDAGAGMASTLRMVKAFRKENQDTPLVLMGYTNPIFIYGIRRFCADAAAAGVDGLIIVDMPPEESADLAAAAQDTNLDLIRLVTPTTDEERLTKILEGASGFLYYVSITGVTGTASADVQKVEAHIRHIRTQTDLPVAVGFGIKTPEDAAAMGAVADGVVVGSAIVQNIVTDHEKIPAQVRALSAALSAA